MAIPESPEINRNSLLSVREKMDFFQDVWNNPFEMMFLAELILDDLGAPADFMVLDVNPSFAKGFGIAREQAIGKRMREVFPYCGPKCLKRCAEVVRTGRPAYGLGPKEIPGQLYEPQIFPLGAGARFIMVIRDLAELNKRLTLQDQILALVSEAILIVNENEVIVDCNEGAARILGIAKEDLVGRREPSIIDNHLTKIVKETAVRKQGKDIQIKEIRRRCQDRGEKTLETTIMNLRGPQGQYLGYIVIIEDITEQKLAEEGRRMSEEKFAKAFHHSQTSISITRLGDGVLLEVNDSFLDTLGYRREEVIGKNITELNIWAEPVSRRAMLKQLTEHGSIRNFELCFRRKNGEIGTGLASVDTLEINGERCLLISTTDITKRKKAEEDLRLSEVLFHQTFNFNPLPMCVYSMDSGKCLEVSQTLSDWSGYNRAELLQNRLRDLNLWIDLDEAAGIIARIMQDGFVRNFETRLRTKFGEIKTGLISGTLINWKGEQCVLGTGLDITEIKRYEEKLASLDRLNLIGQMAAGIGHEIRNPMTTVRGFLQLLMNKDRYANDQEFMELMIAELDRANLIITEFLSLAKTRTTDMKLQSLNQKIRNILPLIQADALKEDKRIEIEYGNIPHILIDQNQIQQLMLNLIYNGLEAMSPGGCISIRTYLGKEGVTLAVTDQGGLIPLEVMSKLGTPFFTTKERGTGLGLAICFSIVERHEAKMEIKNETAGTTFFVRFKT